MANEFATGAVAIYVKFPTGSAIGTTPLLLGTSEQGPSRQTDRAFKNLQNDLTSQKPLDYIYAGGEEATLSFVLTWWNEAVARALEAAPISGLIGASNIFDQGTLMGQEGRALEVWYAWAFGGPGASLAPFGQARPSMPGQEGGRHYVQCLFWGPEQDETGTHERKKHMVFRAWKKFTIIGGIPTYTLFDINMSGLPALS